jgi:outer membrane scaffolding protein for murein synthesis (MipA/OmpV family)
MHLSDSPSHEYGPLLAARSKEQRSDTPGNGHSLTTEAGGFYNYLFDLTLIFTSRLMVGGGDDHRGAVGNVGLEYSRNLSSHNNIILDAGAVVADQAYMQSFFGVSPAQASMGGNPVYRPHAGLMSTYTALEWQWEAATKYWITTGIRHAVLRGSARASPLVDQPASTTEYVALVYHF